MAGTWEFLGMGENWEGDICPCRNRFLLSDLAPGSEDLIGNVIKGWVMTDSSKNNNMKSGHILLDINTVKTYEYYN